MKNLLVVSFFLLSFTFLISQQIWDSPLTIQENSSLRMIYSYESYGYIYVYYQDLNNNVYVKEIPPDYYYDLIPDYLFTANGPISHVKLIERNYKYHYVYYVNNCFYIRRMFTPSYCMPTEPVQLTTPCLDEHYLSILTEDNNCFVVAWTDMNGNSKITKLNSYNNFIWDSAGLPLSLLPDTRLSNLFSSTQNQYISIMSKQNTIPEQQTILMSVRDSTGFIFNDIILDTLTTNDAENNQILQSVELSNQTILLAYKSLNSHYKLLCVDQLGQILWTYLYEDSNPVFKIIPLDSDKFLVVNGNLTEFNNMGTIIDTQNNILSSEFINSDFKRIDFEILNESTIKFVFSYLKNSNGTYLYYRHIPAVLNLSGLVLQSANLLITSPLMNPEIPHGYFYFHFYDNYIYGVYCKEYSNELCNFLFFYQTNSIISQLLINPMEIRFDYDNYYNFPYKNRLLIRNGGFPRFWLVDENQNKTFFAFLHNFERKNLFSMKTIAYRDSLLFVDYTCFDDFGEFVINKSVTYKDTYNYESSFWYAYWTLSHYSNLYQNNIWNFCHIEAPDESVIIFYISNPYNQNYTYPLIYNANLKYAFNNYFIYSTNSLLRINKINEDASFNTHFDQNIILSENVNNKIIAVSYVDVTDDNLKIIWSEKENETTSFYMKILNSFTGESLWENPELFFQTNSLIINTFVKCENDQIFICFQDSLSTDIHCKSFTFDLVSGISSAWEYIIPSVSLNQFSFDLYNHKLLFAYISDNMILRYKTLTLSGQENNNNPYYTISTAQSLKKPGLTCVNDYYSYITWIENGNKLKCQCIDLREINTSTDIITSNQAFKAHNYPNPFNPETIISLNIPEKQTVSIDIYNVKGQKVRSLFNGDLSKGEHKILFNGKNDLSQPIANGLYFYRIVGAKNSLTGKMILIK